MAITREMLNQHNQEKRAMSPDPFPRERTGLGMRLLAIRSDVKNKLFFLLLQFLMIQRLPLLSLLLESTILPRQLQSSNPVSQQLQSPSPRYLLLITSPHPVLQGPSHLPLLLITRPHPVLQGPSHLPLLLITSPHPVLQGPGHLPLLLITSPHPVLQGPSHLPWLPLSQIMLKPLLWHVGLPHPFLHEASS